METMFLASIWGPVLLAAGIGFFTAPKYYEKIYRDLEKAPFAVLLYGLAMLAAGIAHVQAHNSWGSFQEGLISLLGWGLVFKGFAATAFPQWVDEMGNWWAKQKMLPAVGILMLALGLYLSFMSYFA